MRSAFSPLKSTNGLCLYENRCTQTSYLPGSSVSRQNKFSHFSFLSISVESSGQTGMKNYGHRVAVLHLLVFFFFRDRVSLLFHFGRLWEDPPVLTRWGDVRIMPVDRLSAVSTRTFRSVFPNGVACCARTLLYPWLGFSKSSLPPLPSPPLLALPFPRPEENSKMQAEGLQRTTLERANGILFSQTSEVEFHEKNFFRGNIRQPSPTFSRLAWYIMESGVDLQSKRRSHGIADPFFRTGVIMICIVLYMVDDIVNHSKSKHSSFDALVTKAGSSFV